MTRHEAWSIPGGDARQERPSLMLALRARWLARRGRPTEEDVPPISTFPGRKATIVPGQMDIDGRVHVPQVRSRMMRRDAG